jgi:NADH:ubiquinone oxidoreductase subunit F (NADH-binding)
MPETRIVLKNCERNHPEDLGTYLAQEGFQAWEKCRKGLSPEEVVGTVKASGLLGRGGAGFPCGLKWEKVRQAPEEEKYLIGNAAEGEPGTFKDRYLLAHDPFLFLEGMAIAAYAVGAQRAFIYLRKEYQDLFALLEQALAQVKEAGFLDHVDIRVALGSGGYICGEETALLESLEGKRGEPRYKPPYPPEKGLFGKPTLINNVETLANIPQILLRGPEWFKTMGTEKSKGTKVFSVSGDVEQAGVYEVLMGTSLREVVENLAGAQDIQAVQVGGAAGRLVPAAALDVPLAFEHILGSGAIMVFNQDRDMLNILFQNVRFLNEESCGKCSPCREGTEVMREIFGRWNRGHGREEDLKALEILARTMGTASLCGLGQSASVPVLDALHDFPEIFDQRLAQSGYLKSMTA